MAHLLVTGGAGYIGSHCLRALLRAGHTGVVIESLTRGRPPRSSLCTACVDSDQFSEPGGGGTAAAARTAMDARLPPRAPTRALDRRTARAGRADRMLACIGAGY